jgi:hypothetical protein
MTKAANLAALGSVVEVPTGSAPSFQCRAWVNFNGTGTVAIRGSGNVSSITDLGTGNYRANFATAMPDGNYSCSSMRSINNTGSYNDNIAHLATDAPSTSSFTVWTHNQGTASDMPYVLLSFHR